MKTHCELCKCLNLIVEGKKHPSQTVWRALTSKFLAIRKKEPAVIASFCKKHRAPLILISDIRSVGEFIEEVFTTVDRYLENPETQLFVLKRSGRL